MKSRIYNTHKNYVMSHGHHIHKTAADMVIDTMCYFPYHQHDMPQRTCVLCCCSKCPSIVTPSQELFYITQNKCPTIRFHV